MDEVEQIKSKIDITDFISQYLTLKKAGANYKGSCPFHQEKTASFMVSPEKQIFKCFGCGKGGDVFAFLMEMEGLNFREALESLASRTGVILNTAKSKEEYQQEKDIKTRLYQINKLVAEAYHKILLEGKSAQVARDYLKSRGIDEKTIKDFKIGYAPSGEIVKNFLIKKGFSQEEIRQAGKPDMFYQRIIFPIFDVMGNCVGFSGRTIIAGQEPKYLNTPETPIFYKSKVLYGLNLAKTEIKKQKFACVVEGQMDVVLSYQSGVKNVVASSGTALTRDHLEILKRYSPNMTFAFDSDDAGVTAMKKALELATMLELNPRVLVLPKGIKDAGEAVAKDPKIWIEAIKSSRIANEWYFDKAFEKYQDTKLNAQDKKEIAKELLPVIKRIPDEIEKSHYIQLLAKKLSVSENTILEAMTRIKEKQLGGIVSNFSESNNKALNSEELLVGLLVKYPKIIDKIIINLDYKEFLAEGDAQKIYKLLQFCYANSCDKNTNCEKHKNIEKCLEKKLDPKVLGNLKIILLDIEQKYKDDSLEEIVLEATQCAERIKNKNREKTKQDFAILIREAEEKGDIKEVKKLIENFQNIIK